MYILLYQIFSHKSLKKFFYTLHTELIILLLNMNINYDYLYKLWLRFIKLDLMTCKIVRI